MPVKSVIDIEINDEKFKAFTGLFSKYREAVKAMPAEWASVGEAAGEAKSVFEGILAAMLAQNQLSQRVTETQKSGATALRSSEHSWRDISKHAKTTFGYVAGITGSMLKWGAALGAGLAGGGLWGFDKLAGSVTAQRRAALGLGTTYGGRAAFGVSFGHVMDTDSFLGAVGEAMADPAKKTSLMLAGMQPGEMKGDTVDVATNLLKHLRQIAKTTNPAVLGTMIESRGLSGITNLDMMRNLAGTNDEQFGSLTGSIGKNRKDLDVSPDTQFKYLEFLNQMDLAGKQIKTTFVDALVPLTGPLKDLSKSFTDAVKDLAESGTLKHWIEELGHGIEWLATFMKSEDFKGDLHRFKDGLGKIADTMEWIVGKFHKETTGDYLDKYPQDASKMLFMPGKPLDPYDRSRIPLPTPFVNNDNFTTKAQDIIRKSGLPNSLFHSMLGVESSGNSNAVSPKGAVGLMQLMEPAAKEVGVTDRRDPIQSLAGGGEYLKRMMKQFGNFDQALAAYNWGPGNMKDLLRRTETDPRFSGDWRENLKSRYSDVSGYVDKVESGIPKEELRALRDMAVTMSRLNTTRVSIYDATGGSVNATIARVAAGGG